MQAPPPPRPAGAAGRGPSAWLAHPWAAALAVLLLMPLLAQLGRSQAMPALGSSWIWPASGLALVYLWVYGTRWWPVLFLSFVLTLAGQPLAHPFMYFSNAALGTLAPWVAVRFMGTLDDQHRISPVQTLGRLLLWGVLAATLLRSGLNGLVMELLGVAPANLWSERLWAWGASSALGVLVVAVPAIAWLLRRSDAGLALRSHREALPALLLLLALEALRLHLDPAGSLAWPLLIMLLLQALYSLHCGGWGSALPLGVAFLIGLHAPRQLPLEQQLPIALTHYAYVAALGLMNLMLLLARSKVRRRLQQLRMALHGAGIAAWSMNLANGRYDSSANWSEVTGITPAPRELDALLPLVHPEDREHAMAGHRARLRGEAGSRSTEFRVTGGDGSTRWLRDHGEVSVHDERGRAVLVHGMLQDVTAAVQAREQLRRSEQRLRLLMAAMPVGVFQLDADARLSYFNEAYQTLLQPAPGQGIGAWLQDSVHDADRAALQRGLQQLRAGSAATWQAELRLQRGDGHWVWVLMQLRRDEADAGGAGDSSPSLIGSLTDIGAQKRQQQAIWDQAHLDALTGLPNRRLFTDRLAQELAMSQRHGRQLALMVIDLDHFKQVNDNLGHDVGDRLLVQAAERIRACVRTSDTTARLGGDEFTVILPSVRSEAAVDAVARKLVQSLAEPYRLSDQPSYASASIGIAMYPEDGVDAITLMKHADQALYRAKAGGRDRYSHFTAELQAAAQRRHQLTQALRSALAEGQLSLLWQPIVALDSGEVTQAEGLLRWQHPLEGAISPVEFIPLAEEAGLILPIGDWVLTQALALAGRRPDLRLHINVSPRQLLAGDAHLRWPAQLAAQPAAQIGLEITEGLLLEDRPEVMQRIEQLNAAGFEFSVDDFGTGYSALAYLKKFPLHQLKIDRSFVRDLERSASDRAIVEAVIAMAHKLGLRVVAEGVETAAQAALLREAGCDFAQGWYFGRPGPAESLGGRPGPAASLGGRPGSAEALISAPASAAPAAG